MCVRSGLAVDSLRGIAPAVFSAEFWKLLMRHTVPDGFAFRFTRSTRISYSGIARKSQQDYQDAANREEHPGA
jgi:hypothetical protein